MKRNVVSKILILFFVFFLILPVSAEENRPLIVDNAEILRSSETAALEEIAQNIQQEYEIDAVILTIPTLNGQTAQIYADNYFDQNGYGYGDDSSGVLFLLSMEEREWYISTSGKAIHALTDYGIQELAENSFQYLNGTEYFDVFQAFFLNLTIYLDAYEAGTPIDGYADYSEDYYHGQQDEIVYYEAENTPSLFLSLIIGIIIATVVILIMRGSMNSKLPQRNAANYMKSGSFHLKSHQDLFLYSNISKVRRQENKTNHSGGGSSVHRSSSGRNHGGGGGRF